MTVDGIEITTIANSYGTPVMVYSAKDMISETTKFVEDFDRVFFSMKSAPIIGIAQLVNSAGAGCNVAGDGELQVALRAGINPQNILVHGNNKSEADIASALQAGVCRLVVEDEHECDRIERIAQDLGIEKVEVQLRVTPGVEAHTHEAIMTGAIDSKFGSAIEKGIARRVCDRIVGSQTLKLRGFHCHIGSQIFDTKPMAQAAKILAGFFVDLHKDYLAKGIEIDINEINVGGGFGIQYELQDDPPSTIEMARAVKSAVDQVCVANDLHHIEVWVEPGRAIVGRAGVSVYRVGSVKEIPGVRKYVAVDGGMSDNLRPAIYGAVHLAWVDGKSGIHQDGVFTIAGKHCEEGDKLANDASLPDNVDVDDLIVMASTGAYSFAMSSNYNMLTRPAVVLVDSSNENPVREIVRRETIDDILSRQHN